jgi:hypothetical protein
MLGKGAPLRVPARPIHANGTGASELLQRPEVHLTFGAHG